MNFLGHHPISNAGTNAVSANSSMGAGVWIIVIIFILLFIGVIYWLRKKK